MKTPRYKVKDEVYVIRKDKIVKDTIIKIEIENYVEENGYYIVNEFTTIKYITIEGSISGLRMRAEQYRYNEDQLYPTKESIIEEIK